MAAAAPSETRSTLPGVEVIYPQYHFYHSFINEFEKGMSHVRDSFFVNSSGYKDQSALLQVVVGDHGTEEELLSLPRYQAIMPIWMSTQFGKSLGEVKEGIANVIDALKYKERNRPSIVDKIIAWAPYLEIRGDHDPSNKHRFHVGEALSARTLAKLLDNTEGDGVDEMVLLGPHSNEGLQFLRNKNIKVVPATAIPLFAEHIKENLTTYDIEKENLEFVALDKGSLQQNIKLCQMMDLDPATHVAAFDKGRKGENVVDASNLIYGDPQGKDVVICDDIIDTFGSIDATVQSLRKKFNCKSVTVMVTHGVLSHPGRANILKALLETHSVDRVIMTDSLPKANYDFEKQRIKYPGMLPLIPVAQNLGEMTQYLAEHSYEEIMSAASPYAHFILEPRNKEEVWKEFLEKTAVKELIPIG